MCILSGFVPELRAIVPRDQWPFAGDHHLVYSVNGGELIFLRGAKT